MRAAPIAASLMILWMLPAKSYAAIAFYYGSQCSEQNATASAVVASFQDALVANEFIPAKSGHALIGGIVLDKNAESGVAANISCQDRPAAFGAYVKALNGALGQAVTWKNERGTAFEKVTIVRDYHNGAMVCRDFKLEGSAGGRPYSRAGTACRHMDGNWHFE